MNNRILIVEDEENIREIVQKYLKKSGYKTFSAKDGMRGLYSFYDNDIDLIIMDIMMPGIDGFELLKEIRKTSDIPIIMLTAKKAEVDRLNGFDFGADDYIIKPFSPRELVKRVDVLIKRVYNKNTKENKLYVGDLKLDINTQRLYKNDDLIDITTSEYKLLKTFFENKGQVLSREQLIEKSFGYDFDGFNRTIDTHIKRIRRKIEVDYKNPKYILTKYGAGYIFAGED